MYKHKRTGQPNRLPGFVLYMNDLIKFKGSVDDLISPDRGGIPRQ